MTYNIITKDVKNVELLMKNSNISDAGINRCKKTKELEQKIKNGDSNTILKL